MNRGDERMLQDLTQMLANLDVQGAYRGVASRAARARQIGRDDADYLREFRR